MHIGAPEIGASIIVMLLGDLIFSSFRYWGDKVEQSNNIFLLFE